MALGLKRPFQSHAYVLSLPTASSSSLSYDIVPEVSFAQEEADYEAALIAANPGGSNPQPSKLPEFTTATPPGYESISYEYVAPGHLSSSQFEDPSQYSPAPAIVSSFRADTQRDPRAPPGDLGFTPQQIDSAPPRELGLENLLRECDVKEAAIQAFRARGITDRLLFVALDDTTESLRATCKEAFGVNFEHKLELSKMSKAWTSAKVTAETKQKIDAIHRGHGAPVQMLEGAWQNMIRAFKLKYGKHIHPSRLPAQRRS